MSTLFKRNSTFVGTVSYIPLPGEPADLSTVTVTSGFLDDNNITYIGVVVIAGDNKSFTVTLANSQTVLWPATTALWDVKFVSGGVTFYSATETLTIDKNITP